MNLVAKEYVSARTDCQGVLILSHFTGASRELRDAVLINPYNIDQTADAIRFALTMEEDEQRARMERMRSTIREHNVYLWAANLVSELARLRPAQEKVNGRVEASPPP
jgi:trehalose 6-phosphate synthase